MNIHQEEELNENPKYRQMYLHSIQKYLDFHPEVKSKYGWTAEQWIKWWTLKEKDRVKNNTSMFDEEDDE